MRRFGLVLLVVTGCHVGSGNPAVIDDLKQAQFALAGCASGDLATNLAIVSDLRESYHEMIVCGGLALDFDDAILHVIANAAIGRGGPSALVYQGNGTYATSNGMMMLRTSLTGGSGIGFDVLDPQSYLAGISVNANGLVDVAARGGSPWSLVTHAAGSLQIQFQGQGPGFALLGLSADQARGGRLDLDLAKIADALASHISIANRINVDNEQGGTTVHYILEGGARPLNEIRSNKTVPMTLASIQATRAATNQTIKITDWTMQFRGDGGKVLDGSIALDVTGGAFPYSVRFTYPHRMDPDIQLSCLH
ncbi:MAG: hypothetical protein JWO36_860 [Myxococcales bacterium]|nr:hypothetical protein [Myxococcales bacterium]